MGFSSEFGAFSQIASGLLFIIGLVYIFLRNFIESLEKKYATENLGSQPEQKTISSQYFSPSIP